MKIVDNFNFRAKTLKTFKIETIIQRFKDSYKNTKLDSFSGKENTMIGKYNIGFSYVKLNVLLEDSNSNIDWKTLWNNEKKRLVIKADVGFGKSSLLSWLVFQWSIGS